MKNSRLRFVLEDATHNSLSPIFLTFLKLVNPLSFRRMRTVFWTVFMSHFVYSKLTRPPPVDFHSSFRRIFHVASAKISVKIDYIYVYIDVLMGIIKQALSY